MWQILAGVSVGILSASWFPVLPELPILAVGASVTFILTVLSALWFPRIIVFCFLVLGLCYGFWQGHALQSCWLEEELEGKNLTVTGYIASLPVSRDGRSRFLLKARYQDQDLGIISLSWYEPLEKLQAGQEWQLCVRLKRPNGFVSPGARDYQAWLLRQDIVATGYVRTSDLCENRMTGHRVNTIQAILREPISHWIETQITGPGSAMARALLVGDTRGLDADSWNLFAETGTVHLLVISGLHISLVALSGWLLVRTLALAGLIPLNLWPVTRVAAVVSLVMTFGYGVLAGFSLPVQRALVMLAVGTGSVFLGFRLPLVTVFLLALTVVLLLDPLAGVAAGFWLSFMAVAALLYVFSHRRGSTRIRHLIKSQLVVALALMPLLADIQQPVNPLSPLINLVSIPLVGGLLVPTLLAGLLLSFFLPAAGIWVMQQAAQVLEYWLHALKWCLAQLPGNVWLPPPQGAGLLGAVVGVVLLLSPSGLRWRWLGVLCLLPWLWPVVTRPEWGSAEVNVLDVGQGLAVVIVTQNHTLVYDTGDRFSSLFSAADAVILPWLRHRYIDGLDLIIISHSDRDHIGGLEKLQQLYPETAVFSSDRQAIPAAKLCAGGISWEWDGVMFSFLGGEVDGASSANDDSCVLMIDAEGDRALLTGDISRRREKRLIRDYGDELQSDLLLVPHHGSAGSSSELFLDFIKPRYASISAGYRNRFNHPSPKAVKRLEQQGAEVLTTAVTGTQTFVLGNDQDNKSEPKCSRGLGGGWWKRILPNGQILQNCSPAR